MIGFPLLLSAISVTAQVSLDSCRQMALRNNKELSVEKLKIEQAEYLRKEAQSAYKPSVDFTGTYLYNRRNVSLVDVNDIKPTKFLNRETGNYDFPIAPDLGVKLTVDGKLIDAIADKVKDAFTFDAHNVFAASVLVTQPIYMGGKIRALNKITNYAENIARHLHDRKAEELIYNVDQAYWLVVSLRAKEKLAESYLKLVTNLDEDVSKLLAQGVATRSTPLTPNLPPC